MSSDTKEMRGNQALAPRRTSHPFIIRVAGICGGSPVIKGTRIRVIDIAIEYDRLGYSPDQIVDSHPHLSLFEVHDALSFYYENQKELGEEMRLREKKVSELKKMYPSKMKELYGKD